MVQLITYSVISIGVIIWLIKASKDKSKWGINLKRVYCPVCKTKQPIIRMPNNLEQATWGGTTCTKCKTNLDKYGKVIPK